MFPPASCGARLGLGGAALGNLFAAISDDDAHAVVAAALHDGCRAFDTAPHYGNGLSEHRVGAALRAGAARGLVVSSKVGRIMCPDPSAPRDQNGYLDVLPFVQRWDFSARGVRRSIEDSLQRLGRARIDVAFIHDCDRATQGSHYDEVLYRVVNEAVPELIRMKSEGLIDHYGLGVNDVQVCLDVLRATQIDCLLLAGRYTLLDQSALPELIPLCLARGVRIAVGGVFNSGILATGVRAGGAPLRFNYGAAPQQWVDRAAAIEEVCEDLGVPLRAAAIQYPLACGAVDVVMAGAQTPGQWRDTLAMASYQIPPALWHRLRDLRLLPETTPPSRR